MKKRIISFALMLALIVSLLSGVAFAAEPEETDFLETSETTESALKDAAADEGAAATEALENGKRDIAFEEGLAALNEALAEGTVETVEAIVEREEGYLEHKADQAEQEQQKAEDAQDAALANEESAEHAEEKSDVDAAVAYSERLAAEEATETAAADEAMNNAYDAAAYAAWQADVAAKQALEAQQNADLAKEAAEAAKAEYEKAQKSYDATVAQVKADLALGLITAEAAEKLTDDAQKKADSFYNEMLAKQDAAQKATEAAKQYMQDSADKLKEETENLEKVIAENALEVAKDTAAAAVTGAALAATQIAVDLADKTVEYYEGQIEGLEEQIAELDRALAEADEQIAEAQAQLDAMDKSDSEYTKAKEALEAAQAAKDAAQAIKDKAAAVLAAKESNEAYLTNLTKLQNKVKGGDETAINSLARGVLKNLGVFLVADYHYDMGDSTATVDETNHIFKVVDEDGNEKLIKAVLTGEEGEKYLQFVWVEEKEEPSPVKESTAMTPAGAEYGNNYKAVSGKNEYKIVCDAKYNKTSKTTTYSYKVQTDLVGFVKYDLEWDEHGAYFTIHKLIGPDERVDVTVLDTANKITVYYDVENSSEDSNSINKAIDEANPKYYGPLLKKATMNLQKASSDFESLDKEYQGVKNTLDDLNGGRELTEQERAELKKELAALDEKLNGNLFDEIVRGFISGDYTDTKDALSKVKEDFEAQLKEEGFSLTAIAKALLELPGNIAQAKEDAESLGNVFTNLTDGEFTLDDISSVVDLISGSGIPVKTKQLIISKINELADAAHDKALTDLEEAVKKAEREIAAQTLAVAKAGEELVKATAAYELAKLREAVADAKAANAAELKAKADKAEKAADEALKAYKELMNAKVDDSELLAAKAAYEAAAAAAEKAQKAADAAANAAVKARKNFYAAREDAWKAFLADRKLRIEQNTEVLDINFELLRFLNPNVVGWVYIPGTSVDYPILKGANKDAFTKTDFLNDKDPNGSIALNYECSSDFSDKNSTLFGALAEDGTMFADIAKFTEQSFFDANGTVYVITPDGAKEFKPFAAKSGDGSDIGYKTIDVDADWVKNACDGSAVKSDLTPDAASDQFLTICAINNSDMSNAVLYSVLKK